VAEDGEGPSALLLGVITLACAALVANLYYAQPLIAAIAPALGIPRDLAGSVVSVTQVGYGIGLFFLVSLADLVENRRLVIAALAVTVVALVVEAVARGAAEFFLASFVVGLCSTAAQVLIPFVAHLVPGPRSGRAVGNLMAGLLTGIMLARPLSLFVAGLAGWRTMFWASAVLLVLIGVALARLMPTRKPGGHTSYGAILASMIGLMRRSAVLRRRAIYQGLMFAAFNMFWTAAPIMLADRFGLSQQGIALFALAGAGGALAAPFAGRLADRGHVQGATAGAMAAMALAFLPMAWARGATGLLLLVVLTVIVDAAVQTNQVVSQRVIFAVPSRIRGRVNGVYMTVLFAGGALGSLLGTASYQWGGWAATVALGGMMGVTALVFFWTEKISMVVPAQRGS
jgi:predicted MFS family arabinose efflux permease